MIRTRFHSPALGAVLAMGLLSGGCGADAQGELDPGLVEDPAADPEGEDGKGDLPRDPDAPEPRTHEGPIRPAPRNLAVSSNAGDGILQLTFTCGGNADGHYSERRVDGGAWARFATECAYRTPGHIHDGAVDAGREYCYRVTAFNETDRATTAPVCVRAREYRRIPEAPEILEPGVRPDEIVVKWKDMSRTEDYFLVQRRVAGTTAWSDLRQTPHGTGTGSEMRWHDQTAGRGTVYDYRVWARNRHGGVASGIVTARISAPPANVRVEGVGHTELTVRWDDRSDDEDGFRVQYWRPGFEGNRDDVDVGRDATERRITGLAPRSPYRIRVGRRRGGEIDWSSDIQAATTAPAAELRVTSLSTDPRSPSIAEDLPNLTPMRISWRECNDGERSVGHFTRVAWAGGEAYFQHHGGIDRGDCRSHSVVVAVPYVLATLPVTVAVDTENTYLEANEEDNVATLQVTTRP